MRALIASSATGGHIYPALAVAEELVRRDPETEIIFVGAKWEIGKDIVKTAGYRQVFIDAAGIDRKNLFKNFSVLLNLARSGGEIKKIIRDFKPDVCIGTGGHVSGPVIRVAKKSGVRTALMEQNVIPGMANKIAEKYADMVFVAFEGTVKYFKKPRKVIVSGNPVRTAFKEAAARRNELRKKYGVPEAALCVLVFGGSQGADAINDAGVEMIEKLSGQEGYYIILITGRQLHGTILERLAGKNLSETRGYIVFDYSDAIYELYAAADLIVARAGALTVTEIAQSGKASILVPSPNVTNNHQYYNAKVMADAEAAVLLPEENMNEGVLAAVVTELMSGQDKLAEMGRNAAGLARHDAAGVIVDEILGS